TIYHFGGAIPASVAHHAQIPGRTSDRDAGRRGHVPAPGAVGHDTRGARHRLAIADRFDNDIAVAGAAGGAACQNQNCPDPQVTHAHLQAGTARTLSRRQKLSALLSTASAASLV